MKFVIVCCVFLSSGVFVLSTEENVAKSKITTTEGKAESTPEVIELSTDTFKKENGNERYFVDDDTFHPDLNYLNLPFLCAPLMWKKCSNSSYLICAKLALVHVIEKLDSSESYILLPGISLLKKIDGSPESHVDDITVKHDFNDALDKYLLKKIRKYLGSLTLSVKLLDKNTIDDMRAITNVVTESSETEGRGKKKYMHSLLMAGWMSGATLLALTMKTIAVLSGKALLAALLSLMLSVISAFSHKGHADLKSTTYEIISKPIVAHTHHADLHDGHVNDGYAASYKRSINPAAEIIINGAPAPEDVEHVGLIRKLRDRVPYYSPAEYFKS